MYYNNYKRSNPSDILVYVEEVNKLDKTVLFDFFDSNELNLFSLSANLSFNLEKPTMVLVNNYNGKTIRENTIYSIKQNIIEQWRDNNLILDNRDNSYLIGFIIETIEFKNEVFTSSVSLNETDDIFYHYIMSSQGKIENVPKHLGKHLKTVVRNVGQGNWNELLASDLCKLVYDAGGPMLASKQDIRNIIGSKPSEYSKSNPILILSHWDKDHYHSLLGMTDQELKCFSFFICRDFVPSTTSRILFNRITRALGPNNVCALSAEPKISRGGPTLFIGQNSITDQVVIYNAQKHKNRNISGILLTVKTKDNCIVLPGDCHYIQISRDILPHLNYIGKHNLVVPHHGGKCGKYLYVLGDRSKPKIAAISVGKNHWGHPLDAYVKDLQTTGFKTFETKKAKGDIIIIL